MEQGRSVSFMRWEVHGVCGGVGMLIAAMWVTA